MNHKDQEDLDTWLMEVELASQKIKELASGKMEVDEFDKKEKAQQKKKEAERIKKEEAEERIRHEQYEAKKRGHAGKGEKKTYLNFCRTCHWEYELPTPECLRCKRVTVSYEERYAELSEKVDEYKTNKVKREERKKKWELWKKTQAMVWKKTSTNYSKWDYYTSESDSEKEEAEPIVPKDDPAFKALEMDIEQRNAKRKKDKAVAEEFKTKGNEAMAKQDYKAAAELYSQGLDAFKDIKALWTNRALAYIKLKKYVKAIEDCTRVLDYCECFEEGYTKSADSAFKAFLRRSFSRKEKKDYRMAADDAEQALKLFPKDQQAIDLDAELKFILKHKAQAAKLLEVNQSAPAFKEDVVVKNEDDSEKNTASVDENTTTTTAASADSSEGTSEQVVAGDSNKELKESIPAVASVAGSESAERSARLALNFRVIIDQFMGKPAKEISEDEVKELCERFAVEQDSKIYFFEKKGTARLENLLKEKIGSTFLLADVFLDSNSLFQDQFLKNECHHLIYLHVGEMFKEIVDAATTKDQSANKFSNSYQLIEEALEVLNTLSTTDTTRSKLSVSKPTIEFVQRLWDPVMKMFQQEPTLVSRYLIFVSNLCYGTTQVKKNLLADLPKIIADLHRLLSDERRSGSMEFLRENCYNLLANLLTEESVRAAFAADKYTQILESVVMRIARYDLEAHPKWTKAAEAALALLVNASFQATPEMQAILKRTSIELIIIGRFFKLNWRKSQYFEIFNRSLQILAKLDYTGSTIVERLFEYSNMFDDERFAGHLIRLYANLSTNAHCIEVIKKSAKIDFKYLVKVFKSFIMRDDAEMNFCNSCNLAAYLNDCRPELLPLYSDVIQRLITVCGDRTGNFRKNAAIFLAKLAKNTQNLELIRSLHGIEILHSITPQVVGKK